MALSAYRRLRIFISVSLGFQLCVGIFLGLPFIGRDEIFPVYSWNFFWRIPFRQAKEFALLIHEVAGRRLNPPSYFEQSKILFSRAGNTSAQRATQRLGWALTMGDQDGAARLRRLIEANYLSGSGPVRYDVVERRYDRFEFYRYGISRSVRILASYEVPAKRS